MSPGFSVLMEEDWWECFSHKMRVHVRDVPFE